MEKRMKEDLKEGGVGRGKEGRQEWGRRGCDIEGAGKSVGREEGMVLFCFVS
jgi:hypothetical protein